MRACAIVHCLFGEQSLDRDVHEFRVRVELGSIRERQFLGLDVGVQVVCAVESHARQVKILQDIELLQRREALRVGRQLEHLVALSVGGGDGRDPLARV